MTVCFGWLWPSHCQAPEFLDGPFTRGFSGWLHSVAAPFQHGEGAKGAHYQGTKPAEWEHGSAGRLSLLHNVEPGLVGQLDNDLWAARGTLSSQWGWWGNVAVETV